MSNKHGKRCYVEKYNADYVIKKAENRWLDEIWDGLGVPTCYLSNKCPCCKCDNVFQINDVSRGLFCCSNCNIQGDGVRLIQLYHTLSKDEVIERIGRLLKIRGKEVFHD